MITGHKNLFKKGEILSIPEKNNVPKVAELSVRNLWKLFKDDEYLKSYFPDYPSNVFPDKTYFLKVIIYFLKIIVGIKHTFPKVCRKIDKLDTQKTKYS